MEIGRIKVEGVEIKDYMDLTKQFKLDEGEASTFTLLVKKKYHGILTDDKQLIKLCKIESVKFISAMTIIAALFRKKMINKNEALEKLEKLQGYGRYSNEIYDYFRSIVN